jgi:hypothetical protein
MTSSEFEYIQKINGAETLGKKYLLLLTFYLLFTIILI